LECCISSTEDESSSSTASVGGALVGLAASILCLVRALLLLQQHVVQPTRCSFPIYILLMINTGPCFATCTVVQHPSNVLRDRLLSSSCCCNTTMAWIRVCAGMAQPWICCQIQNLHYRTALYINSLP
jgi:hypothetical protein